MMLGRLNSGVSMARLRRAMRKNPDAVMELVTLAGGFGPTMPEQESTLTVDLTKAGRYVALDMMSGRVLPITATAEGARTNRPQADLVVQMLDFGFDIPAEVEAGEQRWEVVNHGAEVHDFIIFKLQPGVTLDEVMKAMEADPEGEPPMAMVGGAMPMAQNYANVVTMNLEPGTYAALCFIPSPANGDAPHFALGMASEFEVVERLAGH